jgi:NitT/TauT family transport system substrate-binding protein
VRLRFAAAGAAVLLMGLAGCGGGGTSSNADSGSGSGSGLHTVNVGQVQLPIFAPLYVADAKGYFKDAGIKLNLQNIKSGQEGVPLASSGQLDVLVAGFSAGMFNAIHTGLNIKVVGSMGVQPGSDEPSPSAMIVSKKLVDSGKYKSLADLRGHKVGALGGVGGTSAYYISMALRTVGLGDKDVTLVNLSSPDIPSAIKNGSIDAAFVSAPFWKMAVDDGTAKEVWTTPKGTSGTGVIYGGKFATSKYAQPFFDALAHGAQDLQGQERYSTENLKIIGQYTDQTADQVKANPLYTWFPDLHPLADQLGDMEKTWMNIGALNYSDPTPQKQYVDSSFADHVKAPSN